MRSNRHLIRIRSARPGPERRLLQAALHQGLLAGSLDPLLLLEAALPTGVPDLIAVVPRTRQKPTEAKRRRLEQAHLQMLHFLADSGPQTSGEIQRLLNQSPRKVAQILEDLQTAGCVVRERDRFASRSTSKVFIAKRIVAIEAKMRAWRDALDQAVANLWFASHSYILIPALKCLRAIRGEAKKFGVGVLVFDGEKIRTILRPRRQRIPASYGSWLINEWAMEQLR